MSDFRKRILSANLGGGVSGVVAKLVPTKSVKDVAPRLDGLSDTPALDLIAAAPPIVDRFRDMKDLHVSDVVGKCLRQIALFKQLRMEPPPRKISESHAITYAQGNAIHDHVKQRLVDGSNGSAYGDWSCGCGKTKSSRCTLERTKDKKCAECGGFVIKYKESVFRHADLGVQGSPDFLYKYNGIYLTEIKSISANGFLELARPQPNHLFQVAWYWDVLQSNQVPVHDHVSVVYAKKEWQYKTPYKEFKVNAKELQPRLAMQKEAVKAYQSGQLPIRTCKSNTDTDAKSCPVCVQCFSQ